jgi:putative membrane protein insertion efficiency factor
MTFPNRQLQSALLRLIAFYRRWVSPLLPPACRFHPTCSDYASHAVRVHGPVRGTALAVRRVCRCHPFNAGGFDPVPGASRREDDRAPAHSLAMKDVR